MAEAVELTTTLSISEVRDGAMDCEECPEEKIVEGDTEHQRCQLSLNDDRTDVGKSGVKKQTTTNLSRGVTQSFEMVSSTDAHLHTGHFRRQTSRSLSLGHALVFKFLQRRSSANSNVVRPSPFVRENRAKSLGHAPRFWRSNNAKGGAETLTALRQRLRSASLDSAEAHSDLSTSRGGQLCAESVLYVEVYEPELDPMHSSSGNGHDELLYIKTETPLFTTCYNTVDCRNSSSHPRCHTSASIQTAAMSAATALHMTVSIDVEECSSFRFQKRFTTSPLCFMEPNDVATMRTLIENAGGEDQDDERAPPPVVPVLCEPSVTAEQLLKPASNAGVETQAVEDSTPPPVISVLREPSLTWEQLSAPPPSASLEVHNPPKGLMLGGAAPASGTRHRIRTRHSARLADIDTEFDEDLLQGGGLADGLLVSEEEVQAIRRTIWRPRGPDSPDPFAVKMGYHTAWDIGKKGCIALKLRNEWESSVNPSRLRFFIMDGTDPVAFLSIYTRTGLRDIENAADRKKGIVRASAIRDGSWAYSQGRIKIQREGHGKRTMTIDRLPPPFMDAMIVCIREMEVCWEVNRLKCQRAQQRRVNEFRVLSQKKVQQRQSSMQESESCRSAWDAAKCEAPGGDFSVKDQSFVIGATRPTARALVSPSPTVVASVVATTKRKNHEIADNEAAQLRGRGGFRLFRSRRKPVREPTGISLRTTPQEIRS